MSSNQHRIFLKGGVTPDLTEDVLKNFFGVFGEVVDVYTPRDPTTGELKGFAFITFSTAEALQAALKESTYTIEGQTVPITKADPRSESRGSYRGGGGGGYGSRGGGARSYYSQAGPGGASALPLGAAAAAAAAASAGQGVSPYGYEVAAPASLAAYGGAAYHASLADSSLAHSYYDSHTRGGRSAMAPSLALRGNGASAMGGDRDDENRIYVGGVPDEISMEDVKEHFEKYGTVVDVYFPKDKATGKRRTFCYVRFSTFEAADTACARSQRTIKGMDIIEIRIAQPRPGDKVRYAPY